MSRLNHEEQFNFLISCIRHSNNGRVDFGKVADECEIVTKGAAAKRYERMMKAHAIPVNTKATDEAGEVTTPKKRRKRATADNGETDEDSAPSSSKKPKNAKAKKESGRASADHADDSNADNTDDAEVSIKADPATDEEE